jgi:hypothetical protein
MIDLFWQMPGPATFIARINDALGDRKSVVATVPDNLPDGLMFLLQDFAEQAGLYWQRLRWEPGTVQPLRWLAKQVGCDLPASATASDLLHLDAAEGKLFVVDEVQSVDALALGELIAALTEAVKGYGGNWPPRLLVFWPQDTPTPKDNLFLAFCPWVGMLDGTDLALYAACLLRGRGMSPYTHRLTASLASSLCDGDPILCRQLCTQSLETLLEPLDLLRSYGASLGWQDDTPVNTQTGTLIHLEGLDREHPALHAIKGNTREINRLIWSAQIAMLMPKLEERRMEVATRLAPYLKPPFTSDNGTVEDIASLEIGQMLHHVVSRNIRLPAKLYDQLLRLKRVRNALAHLEVIPVSFLLDEDTIRALTK